MDTTVRNVDRSAYRALKARAARSGRTIGELVNEAIRSYLGRPDASLRRGSLRALEPESYPAGNERLSSEIDAWSTASERRAFDRHRRGLFRLFS